MKEKLRKRKPIFIYSVICRVLGNNHSSSGKVVPLYYALTNNNNNNNKSGEVDGKQILLDE